MSEEDRADVIAMCNRIIEIVPLGNDPDQNGQDRSLVFKAVMLSRTVLSESWLFDSLEAVKTHQGSVRGRAMRYWYGVLKSKCREMEPSVNLNRLLKRVVVPEELLAR